MKTNQNFIQMDSLPPVFSIHLDFNLAEMPSGGNELDQFGESHPKPTKNRFQPVGTHPNQLLESSCRKSPQSLLETGYRQK